MARGATAREEEAQGALVPRAESAVALPMEMLAEDAGGGFEEATSEDIAIPFLVILQKGSPQVDPLNGKHIDGATAGQLFNTVSEEVLGDSIDVIHCYFRREVVEWRLREKGGGFVAVHPKDTPLFASCKRDEKNRDVMPNGESHLVSTALHYVMLPDGQRAVIAMSSTQLKKSRKWVAMMAERKVQRPDGTSFTPPSYAQVYHLGVAGESNAKGAWAGWVIRSGPMLADATLYASARAFAQLVREGKATPTDNGAASTDVEE